jgi:glutamine synthetase
MSIIKIDRGENMKFVCEYIWSDGSVPTQKLRSKTKIFNLDISDLETLSIKSFPTWTFDGSSTNQATGDSSDCVLKPVKFVKDPIRKSADANCYLVLCEVYGANNKPHSTNTRSLLRKIYSDTSSLEPLFGIEQEYTMFKDSKPFGWPTGGYPPQQGPFYCGVGSDEVFGRDIVEEHMNACLAAGLPICGINSEVMPGQWEFQIGPSNALQVSDSLILARWILYRIGENHGVTIKLDPKPVAELNGAGAHTNFSTNKMREEGGMTHIEDACKKLESRHDLHISNYGDGIERRLTGHHETCSYKTFRYGVSDRGASIRIPLHVAQEGKGYLEDRRPCANMDPYVVTRLILEATCL